MKYRWILKINIFIYTVRYVFVAKLCRKSSIWSRNIGHFLIVYDSHTKMISQFTLHITIMTQITSDSLGNMIFGTMWLGHMNTLNQLNSAMQNIIYFNTIVVSMYICLSYVIEGSEMLLTVVKCRLYLVPFLFAELHLHFAT